MRVKNLIKRYMEYDVEEKLKVLKFKDFLNGVEFNYSNLILCECGSNLSESDFDFDFMGELKGCVDYGDYSLDDIYKVIVDNQTYIEIMEAHISKLIQMGLKYQLLKEEKEQIYKSLKDCEGG